MDTQIKTRQVLSRHTDWFGGYCSLETMANSGYPTNILCYYLWQWLKDRALLSKLMRHNVKLLSLLLFWLQGCVIEAFNNINVCIYIRIGVRQLTQWLVHFILINIFGVIMNWFDLNFEFPDLFNLGGFIRDYLLLVLIHHRIISFNLLHFCIICLPTFSIPHFGISISIAIIVYFNLLPFTLSHTYLTHL